ncbi:MAG: hypothetical protein WB791_07400 [Waddliaceae bacterium]
MKKAKHNREINFFGMSATGLNIYRHINTTEILDQKMKNLLRDFLKIMLDRRRSVQKK